MIDIYYATYKLMSSEDLLHEKQSLRPVKY